MSARFLPPALPSVLHAIEPPLCWERDLGDHIPYRPLRIGTDLRAQGLAPRHSPSWGAGVDSCPASCRSTTATESSSTCLGPTLSAGLFLIPGFQSSLSFRYTWASYRTLASCLLALQIKAYAPSPPVRAAGKLLKALVSFSYWDKRQGHRADTSQG